MERPYQEETSNYWNLFAKLNFFIAIISIALSVYLLEVDLIAKGYFILSSLYLFTTTVILSKTIRDQEESKKILNKIEQAKTNKILKDYVNE